MGTMIQHYKLEERTTRRTLRRLGAQSGSNDLLTLTSKIIHDIHAAYLEAGADISRPTPSIPSLSHGGYHMEGPMN